MVTGPAWPWPPADPVRTRWRSAGRRVRSCSRSASWRPNARPRPARVPERRTAEGREGAAPGIPARRRPLVHDFRIDRIGPPDRWKTTAITPALAMIRWVRIRAFDDGKNSRHLPGRHFIDSGLQPWLRRPPPQEDHQGPPAGQIDAARPGRGCLHARGRTSVSGPARAPKRARGDRREPTHARGASPRRRRPRSLGFAPSWLKV
jgi:hypothetical protein